MNPASLLYRLALNGSTPVRQLASVLRSSLLRFGVDPDCSMTVHGRDLCMPLSHGLPVYAHSHALYDALPGRLANALRAQLAHLRVVDVGANIGDTPAALGVVPGDRVLAIEPNAYFARFIQRNWPDPQQVQHVASLCTAKPTQARFSVKQNAGTASFLPNDEGIDIPALPLDDLLDQHPGFGGPHLIKIDTDGHDFEVLEGASRTLARFKPVVLFECDIFGRSDYSSAVMRTLGLLASCGYSHVLVYDHLGNLFGRFDTEDRQGLANLLFHQCLASRRYFDVVAAPGPWIQSFLASELAFFEAHAKNKPGIPASAVADAARVAAAGGRVS